MTTLNKLLNIVANVATQRDQARQIAQIAQAQRDEARLLALATGAQSVQIIALLYAVALVDGAATMQFLTASALALSIVIAICRVKNNADTPKAISRFF